MNKFKGVLGIRTGYETVNSVCKPVITRYPIAGDMYPTSLRNTGDKSNKDITFTNRFSFIAPVRLISMLSKASNENTMALYIEWHGMKLSVEEISFAYPRINVTTGGLWNEPFTS